MPSQTSQRPNTCSVGAERPHLPADLPAWARGWLLMGMWWLLVGIAASPVGSKVWNPGKHYHHSLVLLFELPALWWVIKRWSAFRRYAFATAEGPLLAVFLAWAMLSVAWADYGQLGDAAVVIVFIVLFALVWAGMAAAHPQRFRRLLLWSGVGLALSALVAMLAFPWRTLNTIDWQVQDRLVSFGVLNNPNLAAYAYGAAIVWLVHASVRGRALQVLQFTSILLLAVFVAQTESRASWLAVLASMGVMLLAARHRRTRRRALAVLALAGVALALGGWEYVLERGLSYRPQIFDQAWHLIEVHPWRGLGMGSHYTIRVGDQVWPHSHNVFTHTAIILGVPATLVWIALWLLVCWRGWCYRHTAMGRSLLAMWVYATVAWQFDAPELLQKPSVEWLLGWLPLAMGAGLAWRQRDLRAIAVARRRVSLIVITYNWPAALERVLRSVAAQSRLPDEVIVADDGSGDDTRRLIASLAADFPVPLRHIWQEDLGFRAARCRNLGIAAARGDYVVLIDGDMVLHRDFVADHLMLAEPGHFLQGGRFKTSARETARLLAGGRPVFAPWADADFHVFDGIRRLYAFRAPALALWKARRRNGGRVMSCNMSFWRSDLLRVNGFDERMEGYGAEDRELAARLGNAGVQRRQLKWAALAAHLEHATRAQPDVNDLSLPNNRLFHATVAERITRCEFGVDRHLAEAPRDAG